MNGIHLTPVQAMAAVGVLLVFLLVWRAGARRAHTAADAARAGARLLSLTGRVVVGALVIAGVQWLALSQPSANGWMKLAALVMPALFGSFTLVRALTVTTVDSPRRRRGGGRR